MPQNMKSFQGERYKLGISTRSTQEANEAAANFRRQGYKVKMVMNEYGYYQVWIRR